MNFFNKRSVLYIQWQNSRTVQARTRLVAPLTATAEIVLFIRAGSFPDNYHKTLAVYKRRLNSLTGLSAVVSKINRVKMKSEVLVLKRASKQNLKIVLKSFFPCSSKNYNIFNVFTLYKLVSKQLRALYKLEVGFLPALYRTATSLELRLINPDLCVAFLQNSTLKPNRRNYVVTVRILHSNKELMRFIKYRLRHFFYNEKA